MTEVLDARGDPPPREPLARAAELLGRGLPVVVPTETVYGLAVDPFAEGATDRLFELKERPRSVPVAVLVASIEDVEPLVAAISPGARRLMERRWPGPLTLVLPRRPDLPLDLGAASDTIGVRCPAHPVPLALAASVGPLATTSANRHGEPTPHLASEVAGALSGGVGLVLDGGPCAQPASTVLRLTGDGVEVLREGPISRAEALRAMAPDG